MKKRRKIPITKQLSNKYGGVWHHIPFRGLWYCKELDLQANFVFEGGYDINGSPMNESSFFPKGLYVYGLETGPEKFYPKK